MGMPVDRIPESGFRIQGNTAGFPDLAALLAAAAIRGYQRWISPYKGFVCAHRRLYDGHSCSEFARLAILRCGLKAALPGIRNQFSECRAAARRFREQRRSDGVALARRKASSRTVDDRVFDERERKRKRLERLPGEGQTSSCPDWCLIGDFGCDLLAGTPWW
jgi:putative component of membrane protein insertase Oxa1/YidC/SpoIIIJ protein YidD